MLTNPLADAQVSVKARRKKTGPSIQDVARLAGVSAQTVSRVSTGGTPVREATRERVLEAMNQLGYSPNRAARALRNGSFGTIGLLAHRFERTGESLTLGAVVEAAEAQGYSVTLLDVQGDESQSWTTAATRLSNQAIDGLIIIRAEQDTPELLSLPNNLPVMVSDSRLVGVHPSVVADQVQGSIQAVRHLLDLGHKMVHHLAGPSDSEPAAARESAWTSTLQLAGITPPPVWRGNWTAASGYELGKQIAEDASVTAVYCANDEMAIGLLRALHEQGRRVPEEVSLIGFDDIALSEYSTPPLTTVRQDFHQVGEELVRALLDQVRSGRRARSTRVFSPTELIVRQTTAPPPKRD